MSTFSKRTTTFDESLTSEQIMLAGTSLCETIQKALSYSVFCIFVATNAQEAERIRQIAEGFLQKRVEVILERDGLLMVENLSYTTSAKQTKVLIQLLRGELGAVVITINALCENMPSPTNLKNGKFEFRKGQDYDYQMLSVKLTQMGYTREQLVESEGKFAMRGDILDIFPIGSEFPVRLEFFGDTLEKIKYFDVESQKSIAKIDCVSVYPISSGYSTEQLQEAIQAYLKENNTQKARQNAEKIRSMPSYLSFDFLSPYLQKFTIRDYISYAYAVVFIEGKQIAERQQQIYKNFYQRLDGYIASGNATKTHRLQLQDPEQALKFDCKLLIETSSLLSACSIITPKKIVKLSGINNYNYLGNIPHLVEDLKKWKSNNYHIVISAGEKLDSVLESIKSQGIKSADVSVLDANDSVLESIKSQGIRSADISVLGAEDSVLESIKTQAKSERYLTVLGSKISEGYINHSDKFVLIGYGDLFKERQGYKKRADVFSSANIGDYVVHEEYGVARCLGITKISQGASEKEYLQLEFFGGDKLYTPCDNLAVLSKYAGGENPKLSKLGGKEFEQSKEKARKSIRELAFDIKKLYANRERKKGFAFSEDNEIVREFENSFEYVETPDQLQAVSEIKADMQSEQIMDRLLCGDVGFGKTEVALRAAFKAVLDGKQVALLSPTTILSQQHYNLMKKRFSEFGLRIGLLNRFCKANQIKQTLSDLKEGKIDIISGTHRLLSSDVVFADLGLLILDEEQRFGVSDKEKLKLLKEQIDVLTLTATPIPRTLHMSLAKIRDISVLATPPTFRLPIATFVCEYSDSLIVDVLSKEIARGGQAFVLYNKVAKIYEFAHHIATLLPNAKIAVAHGQMRERQFEDNIISFYQNRANVLVCSTIIENGIDIQNANTMVVIDSDMFGLSQLYQLRGRVGRSNRLASVYFTFDGEKVLSETAYKRLMAISEFTELGSGFKLAMRDLELRGAGDVLGARQSGQIEKIGYDLYLKILNEEISLMQGKKAEQNCEVNIDCKAYLPETYIPSSEERIRIYQNLAKYQKPSDIDDEKLQVADVYGRLPTECENLFLIAKLRVIAQKCGAIWIKATQATAGITFGAEINQNKKLQRANELFAKEVVFSYGENAVAIFSARNKKPKDLMRLMTEYLSELI